MDITNGINDKDKNAFKIFFDENFVSLVMFIKTYLKDTDKASDIAQECFIRLWKENLKFNSEENIKGFIYVTAKNLCLNEIKHKEVVDRYSSFAFLDSDEYVKSAIFEEEVYGIIYKPINSFAPRSRKFITLVLQDFSNGEIAEKLNISVNSVRTLKQNAYKRLRLLLKDYIYTIFILELMRFH